MCTDKRVTEEIIQCLIEYFPDAIKLLDDGRNTVLHYACRNKSMTRGIMQLLIDAAPDTLRSVNNYGYLPLHTLCIVKQDDFVAMEILKLFLEKYPGGAARRAAAINYGCLPIHYASESKSPEFCQALIEAYPGSEQIANFKGLLPLHCACSKNSLGTVEYLHKLYPDAINHADTRGCYPIHKAIGSWRHSGTPPTDLDCLKYLLDCDPNVKLQKRWEEMSLLVYACWDATNGDATNGDATNGDATIEEAAIIYDAHPEAIEDDSIEEDFHHHDYQVQSFINSELVYARQAKDRLQMMTPDAKGHLPLHTALQNNVRLGSIKLLVKGNPSALRTLDNNFALPLHIACENHDSVSVIQHLIDLDMRTLRAVDIDNNTALHYACRGAKYDTIALLLKEHDAISVSKRNALRKLPIDLLWESNEVLDRDSIEYTQSVFRLLRAYPETLMNFS